MKETIPRTDPIKVKSSENVPDRWPLKSPDLIKTFNLF